MKRPWKHFWGGLVVGWLTAGMAIPFLKGIFSKV